MDEVSVELGWKDRRIELLEAELDASNGLIKALNGLVEAYREEVSSFEELVKELRKR